jgi:hypothetical protein
MIWVGGGIIIHGLEEYGLPAIGHAIHDGAEAVGHALPAIAGAAEWIVTAAASGIFGLLLGAALIPFVQYVLAPLWKRLRGRGADAAPAAPLGIRRQGKRPARWRAPLNDFARTGLSAALTERSPADDNGGIDPAGARGRPPPLAADQCHQPLAARRRSRRGGGSGRAPHGGRFRDQPRSRYLLGDPA